MLVPDDPSSPVFYLKDHVVKGRIIFPSAAYIEMVVSAVTQLGLQIDKIALQNILYKLSLVPLCF